MLPIGFSLKSTTSVLERGILHKTLFYRKRIPYTKFHLIKGNSLGISNLKCIVCKTQNRFISKILKEDLRNNKRKSLCECRQCFEETTKFGCSLYFMLICLILFLIFFQLLRGFSDALKSNLFSNLRLV